MDNYNLTEGALRIIMRGGEVDSPIMQVLGSKKIATVGSDKERYRILLSDGLHFISFAMFTTQINEKVESGDLPMFSVIKVKRYITSVINNSTKNDKRILVILDLEVVVPGDKVKMKIGSPEMLPEDDYVQPKAEPKPNRQGNNTAGLHASTSSNKQNGITMNEFMHKQITHPISSLTPYQNKWIIKARVSNKSNVRTWSNSRGEGKLFSVDLVDETGEIRATAFRDMVDKFYDYIEIDKVYYISKCQLKPANKQYTTIKNDYEMTFTNDTIVQLCEDDVDNIPQTQYNFITIDKVGQMEVGAFVDVIGVCKSATDLQMFQARSTGREMKKREVTIHS